jgi:hypothetical protein
VILNIHEDKCVNKHWCRLKMDYKRQTVVLSVMFVLVGMVLISAITEKALAIISGLATTRPGPFSHLAFHMDSGKFLIPPHYTHPLGARDELQWITIGSSSPFGGGDEKGYVAADAGPRHVPVTFHFFNPARGTNTCSVDPVSVGSCRISQGPQAGAVFTVNNLPSPALSDSNDGDNEDDNSGDTP